MNSQDPSRLAGPGVLVACFVALAFASCGDDSGGQQRTRPPVATVGATAIPEAELDRRLELMHRRLRKIDFPPGVSRAHIYRRANELVATSLVEAEWIEQEAARQTLTIPPGPRRSPDRITTLRRQLIDRHAGNLTATEQEIRTYNRTNPHHTHEHNRPTRQLIEDIKYNDAKGEFATRLQRTYQPHTKCRPSLNTPFCDSPSTNNGP